MSRVGRVERTTKETSVVVEIDLDGTGRVDVSTGVGFFDHMLDQLGRHGLFDLTVKTDGDLHIDSHHTIEDTALALGAAFRQASATRSASTASATARSRWTSPSPGSPSTSPAARTSCTPNRRTWRR